MHSQELYTRTRPKAGRAAATAIHACASSPTWHHRQRRLLDTVTASAKAGTATLANTKSQPPSRQHSSQKRFQPAHLSFVSLSKSEGHYQRRGYICGAVSVAKTTSRRPRTKSSSRITSPRRKTITKSKIRNSGAAGRPRLCDRDQPLQHRPRSQPHSHVFRPNKSPKTKIKMRLTIKSRNSERSSPAPSADSTSSRTRATAA